MEEDQVSDSLKYPVWSLIGLAILWTIIALVLYCSVELPAQQAALHAPAWNKDV